MSNQESTHDAASLPDLLLMYYKRLFPYKALFRWFNYGGVPKTYFTHREFSFTLADDVYIRYQSFSDQAEMEKEIQKMCPRKIDIGAVFTHRPKDHRTVKAAAFQAEEKELVFDIDITDYDDVRICCSGADICLKCWPLMTVAMKIIDRALREDFGYEHLLWVYSGRRGIHCWVCDASARILSTAARSAIAEYLSLVKGGENQARKVNLPEVLHPSVQTAVNIVSAHFDSYAIKKQDFLGSDEQIAKVLQLIPEEAARLQIETDLKVASSTKERWAIIKRRIKEFEEKSLFKKAWPVVNEIQLQYCYPRLDVNVSKGVNHLLKCPFCVHPKTGRVCVPIDFANVDSFDPFTVPTLTQLHNEINEWELTSEEDGEKRRVKDYKSTSMKEPMDIFETFLNQLELSHKGARINQSDEQMEF